MRVDGSLSACSSTVQRVRLDYRRAYPRPRERFCDLVDFTSDEPWSWEDGDFGLLVFHVATDTGPVKYRHVLMPPKRKWAEDDPDPSIRVTDHGVFRPLPGQRRGAVEAVAWTDLQEVRAKFEVAGI